MFPDSGKAKLNYTPNQNAYYVCHTCNLKLKSCKHSIYAYNLYHVAHIMDVPLLANIYHSILFPLLLNQPIEMVEIPTPFTNLQLSGPGGTGFLGDFGATLALETTLAFGAALGFTGSTFQGTATCQGLGQGMAINKLRPMSIPKCLGLASLKDLCIQDLCLGFLSWEPLLLQLPLQFLQLGPLRCSTLTNKRHSVNSKPSSEIDSELSIVVHCSCSFSGF